MPPSQGGDTGSNPVGAANAAAGQRHFRPLTGGRRPGRSAKSERAAHKLVHDLVTKAASDEVVAADVTLNQTIDRWLELSAPSEASTRDTYDGYIKKHIRDDIGKVSSAASGPRTSTAGTPG